MSPDENERMSPGGTDQSVRVPILRLGFPKPAVKIDQVDSLEVPRIRSGPPTLQCPEGPAVVLFVHLLVMYSAFSGSLKAVHGDQEATKCT